MKKLFASVILVLLSLVAGALAAEAQGPTWTIFTTQTPTETLDASPGWEVGTRFSSSKAGKVIGFRFWRAAGETGSNYGKLWTNSGQRLKMSKAFPSGTGWVEIYLDTPVSITANTTYRVSVNTNTKQVKKVAPTCSTVTSPMGRCFPTAATTASPSMPCRPPRAPACSSWTSDLRGAAGAQA